MEKPYYAADTKESLDSRKSKSDINFIMAQRVKISYISNNDGFSAYEKISHVGGVNYNSARRRLTSYEVLTYIKNRIYSFYTGGTDATNIVVPSRKVLKYIRTEVEANTPDDLLNLLECF